MRTVNADYGIDIVPALPDDRRWFRWHRFPLVPIVTIDRGDQWNTRGFCFSWLNLRVWTTDSIHLVLGLNIEDVGVFVTIDPPYLRIRVWLLWFPRRWYQKLWHRSPGMK